MRTTVDLQQVSQLVSGNHPDPFHLLGPHEISAESGHRAVSVRAFLPEAKQAWVKVRGLESARPMRRIHPAGFYEAICPYGEYWRPGHYELHSLDAQGTTNVMHDPYSFPPLLTGYDRHLLGEGNH